MPQLLTKEAFVKAYSKGALGNRTVTWSSVAEFMEEVGVSVTPTLYHLRNRIVGDVTFYNLRNTELYRKHREIVGKGYNPKQFYVSQMAPTEETIIQGECMRGIGGIELTYSTVVAPMREALAKETKLARGITAILLLRHYLDPCDYEWLCELMEEYNSPSHVVEFSHYRIPCGVLKRRMIVWEVRGGY